MIEALAMRNGEGGLQRHRLRIAKLELLQGFSDDDCRTPVRHEVHVVGIRQVYRTIRLTGFGVDRHKLSTNAAVGAARYPKCLQVPGGNNVLRCASDFEAIHNSKRSRINHIHIPGRDIRNIDSRQCAVDGGAESIGCGFAIKIRGIHNRRHSRQCVARIFGGWKVRRHASAGILRAWVKFIRLAASNESLR